MFYQTQIVKLYAGGAVDSHDKFLKFIGRFPCKEGDYVWTDGRFIFGHVPFREEPNIINLQGGIPAAFADDKGYFSKIGNFNKYSIAVDETAPRWIVNGKRKYFHSDTRVFDAEISIDENGVEDGLFTAELDGINGGNAGIYFIKDGTILDDDAVVIKKDGKEISRVYLHDFTYAFDKFDEKCNEYPCEIVELIGHAQLLNFRLHSNGKWDAIIASSVQSRLRYSSIGYSDYPQYDAIWRTNGYSLGGYSTAPAELGGYFPCFSDADEEGEALAARYNALLAETGCKFKAEDFIPVYDDTPSMTEWFDKPRTGYNYSSTVGYASPIGSIDPPSYIRTFGQEIYVYYLVHVNSNNDKNILQEEIYSSAVNVYKNSFTLHDLPYPTYGIYGVYTVGTTIQSEGLGPNYRWKAPDCKDIQVVISKDVLFYKDAESIQNIKPIWHYPIQDGFSVSMNHWRILNIFNPEGKSIVNNIAQGADEISSQTIDLSAGFPTDQVFIEPRKIMLRQEGKADVTKITMRNFNGLCGFYRDYRDSSYTRTVAPLPHTQLISRYIVDYNQSFTFLDNAKKYYKLPYIILPAVVKLSNGYLIGIPQHDIYKVDKNGVAELISDKNQLANLRLRYMPNLSKTRR